MSVATKYSLAAIHLDDAADTIISGVNTQGVSLESEIEQEPTSGEVYNRWLSLSGQSTGAQFATSHLATAIAAIGTSLSIGSPATGLKVWLQKHVEGGTRAGAASHRYHLATEGIIAPETLSVAHGGSAAMTYKIVTTYDGSNDPWQLSDSQSMPAAEADDERFALGPMQIGSKSLTQFRQLDIAYNVNVVAEGADGDIWPTFASVESITPVITFKGIDPEWWKSTNVPITGLACTHANTILYLRKRAYGGTWVADNVAEHIKLTAAGLAHVQGFDASGLAAAECSLVLPCRYDGSNVPITADVASTIV